MQIRRLLLSTCPPNTLAYADAFMHVSKSRVESKTIRTEYTQTFNVRAFLRVQGLVSSTNHFFLGRILSTASGELARSSTRGVASGIHAVP